MSVRTSGSVDRDRKPASSYGDASTPNHEHRTPSPDSQDDSQDPLYIVTPTRLATDSSASTVFTTPSHRSNLALSGETRNELDKLYILVYGEDSKRCLVTQGEQSLNAAHVVQRASKSHQASIFLCVWNSFLTVALVDPL